MIKGWLDYVEKSPTSLLFRLIYVTEKRHACDETKSFLAKEILNSYRNLDYLKTEYQNEPKEKLISYIKDYVQPTIKDQIGKNVWQGDFGEVVAELIVTNFEGFIVPMKKIRWKFNKDRSVFCTDMIAHNPGKTIKELYYYEVKTRLNIRKEEVLGKSNYITINAHNSLLKDEQTPNEAVADYLSRLFFEMKMYEDSRKYGDIVRNPHNYNKNFELFFIIEKSKFSDEIIDELNALPPSLSPLRITVVLIDSLGRIIIATRHKAIEEAMNFVYKT